MNGVAGAMPDAGGAGSIVAGNDTAAGRAVLVRLPHALSAVVVRRIDQFDRLLAPGCADISPPGQHLARWLAQLAQFRFGLAGPGWARVAMAAWDGADEATRASLHCCLLRALDPLNAMVTVPFARLFDEREAQAIVDACCDANVQPAVLRQVPGEPTDYGGYLCAILKVTRLCNLRCTYCHDWSAAADSHAGFALLLRAVAQCLQLGRSAVDFVLHGGEPLMMGRRGFLRLLALQAHLSLGGQQVRTHLQTNGTLVDDWWLDALELFGVRASVSLDGPAELHDRTRPDTLGRGSHARALAGIDCLRSRKLLSGVLMVVGEDLLALGPEPLERFLREHGLLSVCLMPERPPADEAGGVDYRRFIAFLAAFEQTCAAASEARVEVREIEAVRRLLAGIAPGFCETGGNCVGAFVSIEADGAVSHCDKYVGSPDYVMGNLWRDNLGAILTGPSAQGIRMRAYAPLAALRACPYFHLCQGGCPHERHVDATSVAAGCCGMDTLFAALGAGHG